MFTRGFPRTRAPRCHHPHPSELRGQHRPQAVAAEGNSVLLEERDELPLRHRAMGSKQLRDLGLQPGVGLDAGDEPLLHDGVEAVVKAP